MKNSVGLNSRRNAIEEINKKILLKYFPYLMTTTNADVKEAQ